MAAVVLYKDKKSGKALKYDFKKRAVELFDYRLKKVKSVSLEELVKVVEEKGKERFCSFQDVEFYLFNGKNNGRKTFFESNYSLDEVLKSVLKFNPRVKNNEVIAPLHLRGIESLVEKELKKVSSLSSHDFKKLKSALICDLLLFLKDKYYVNDDVPSVLSIKRIVQGLIENYREELESEDVESQKKVDFDDKEESLSVSI